MKNKSFIIFLIGIFGSVGMFSSCTTNVTVDIPDYKIQLVANSFAVKDSMFKVNVSHSLNALDNATPPPVNNASVLLYENEILVDSLLNNSSGKYSSIYIPQSGKNYSLKISAPNFKTIESETTVPESVLISSYHLDSLTSNSGNEQFNASLTFSFNDPAAAENYYEVMLYREDTSFDFIDSTVYGISRYPLTLSSQDPAIEITDSYTADRAFITDEFFNGKTFNGKISFEYHSFSSGNLYISFKAVSKEYYLYQKTLAVHYGSQNNPFAEPAQVYSNIKNGLGIFGSYAEQWIKIH